jgi:peptidoglycan/xylan/chitin deacetylase (PgdA/CDA1 family)
MSEPMRACAVSVDLDEIHHYLAIHGLGALDVARHAVYDVALPRLLDWATRRSIPLTLFAVGSDMHREQNRAQLSRAVASGHEIGNHSFSHAYDLSRQDSDTIAQDIRRASEVIESATGYSPRGFRAPGYTITRPVYDALDRQGFVYSSSVFPCPTYYGLKVTAIGLKRCLGRRSSSVVDDPRVLGAPNEPYRIGRPYWRRGVGLLELPIQTTPGLRLPYIGTTLTALGARGSAWLTRQLAGVRFVNLELHGVDFLGPEDGLRPLAAHQYDLRIAVAQKLAALDAALDVLDAGGVAFHTLSDVALRFDLDHQRGHNPAS